MGIIPKRNKVYIKQVTSDRNIVKIAERKLKMERRELFKNALGAISGFFVLPKIARYNKNLTIESKNMKKCYIQNMKKCYIQLYKNDLMSTHTLLNNFNMNYDVEIRRLVRQKIRKNLNNF